MARVRAYIDTDVLTEAKRRLHHIFDLFDSVVVMFSGGKDSLAALHLVHEVKQERGDASPVQAVFRDEELIPDVVIDFIDHYRRMDWVNLLWFCVPLKSNKFILGRTYEYLQWDPSRRHIREKPPWAICEEKVYDQYTMDERIARHFKGKVAFITGIRAAESLIRFRASVNKLNENYINASSDPRVSLCKPIFDWEENDIFRYFWERSIKYCALYDSQLLAGHGLRVSTPLHAESAKRFGALRETSPMFYEQLIDLFPEMLVQERYYSELDREGTKSLYGQSYDGVRTWIMENIDDPVQLKKALDKLAGVLIREVNSPGAYPPEYLLNQFMAGAYKREILPQRKTARQGGSA